MEYCRINNIDVKSKFDLDDSVNQIIYNQMKNIQIYSSIPKDLRGKGIP